MDFSNLDTGQWVVIGLSIFLIVWYVIVGYLNRRRGIRIYRWLREGLDNIGEVTDVHWIGSAGSGTQIKVDNTHEPFKALEATVLMESRELLPLWIFNILRHKRDELILRASLRKSPSQELEITRSTDREFHNIFSSKQKKTFSPSEAPSGFQIAFRGGKKLKGKQHIEDFLEQNGSTIIRISLGHKEPHFVLRCRLADLREAPAENFFSSLYTWLQEM